jgi:hypothetical protein
MKFQPTSKIDGKCIVVTLVDGSKKQEISMEIYTATGPLFGNTQVRETAQKAAKAIVDAKLAETPDARQFGQWMKDNGMKVRV